ncbi:hypothetical protein TNCV_3873671 [Trichonephila clavipes]|nr:hypothetical protein TNCV_3873671 [Trichonephila clavipes]
MSCPESHKTQIGEVTKLKRNSNKNNASQLSVRNATTSDCHRTCSKLHLSKSQNSGHRRWNDFRKWSNKFGVLVMPAEPTPIRAVRSSTVATNVSFTSKFRCL